MLYLVLVIEISTGGLVMIYSVKLLNYGPGVSPENLQVGGVFILTSFISEK